jgi:hypothetical protein
MARWKKAAEPAASEYAHEIAALTEKSARWEADKAATQQMPPDVGQFAQWLFAAHPNPFQIKLEALRTRISTIRVRARRK